jgi:hypothetical protein
VRLTASLVCALVLLPGYASAQDAVPAATTGTAVIRGHVITAGSGRPLARAEVTMLSSRGNPRRIVADGQGMYEFRDLPAAEYELTAAMSGYLSLAHGQKNHGEPPERIRIGNGQLRAGVDILLPASGVIAVRVTDAHGAPAEGAFVQVLSPDVSDQDLLGPRTLIYRQSNHTTDDRGQIRLHNLEPGEYQLSVIPVTPGVPPHERVPIYFPGVGERQAAGRVRVPAGEEVAVDFVIAPPFVAVPPSRDGVPDGQPGGVVAVHVVDDAGNPRAGVPVWAVAVSGADDNQTNTQAATAAADPDPSRDKKGAFTDDRGDARIWGLAAGHYVVVADSMLAALADSEPGDGRAMMYPPMYFPNARTRAGAHVLTLQAWDEVNLELALEPARAAHVSGHVMRWNGEPGQLPIQLRRSPSWLPHWRDIGDVVREAVVVDGAFRFENVAPGTYVIYTSYQFFSNLPDGDVEIEVTVEGEDISDLLLTTYRDREP